MRSDASDNRDRVLNAAEDVFGSAGTSGSTEEVARRAGVGIATVFRHFPTKRQLIEATIVRHLTRLTLTAQQRADDVDAGAAFRACFHETVRRAPAKLTLLAALEARSDELSDDVAEAAARLRDALAALLRRAQEGGHIRADATVSQVYVLIGALAGASQDPRVLDDAINVVLDGLARDPRCA